MKILLVIHSLQGGGAERVTALLANAWAEQGHATTIVTVSRTDGDRYPLHERVGRIVLDLAGDSDGFWGALSRNGRRVLALRRVLKTERPDVAIAMMSATSVVLAFATRGLRRGTYIGTERIYPPMHPLGRGWEWLRVRTYGWLDAIVTQTTQSSEWVLANTRARRSLAIPNPIALPLVASGSVVPPRSVGSPGRRRILAVGRLTEQKGFDLLIDAFASLALERPEWELAIVGEGPQRETLQAQIDRTGLTGSILLPGFAGNMEEWYRDADVFVLSSRFEGFANVLVEAMAHGLPVVSFDCDSGPRDIIRDGIDGLLVPAGNVGALSSALRGLMADGRERARLARRAETVRERFAVHEIVNLWNRVFAELRARDGLNVAAL